MPIVPFIPAIIAGGASIAGGALGSRGASKAAEQQYASTVEARQLLQQLLDQYNPPIGQAAEAGATSVSDAGARSQQVLLDAIAQSRADLSPYSIAGRDALRTMSDLMQPGGDLNRNFTFQDMQQLDPGYQFRMDQASKALQQSAAARGGALGGGTLQALANLNQNLASSEYGAAFDRFRQQQTDRFSRFNTMANMGYNAANNMANLNLRGSEDLASYIVDPAEFAANMRYAGNVAMGNNAMETGRSLADLITGGGAAQASGTMGSANAWANALGGVGNAALSLPNLRTNSQPGNYGAGNDYGWRTYDPSGTVVNPDGSITIRR